MSALDELRQRAELTLNCGDGPWLPYEETWHEMTTAVLALLDVAEAAQRLWDTTDAAPLRNLTPDQAFAWDDLCAAFAAFARLRSGAEERAS